MPIRAVDPIFVSTRRTPLFGSRGVTILPVIDGSSKNTALASLINPPKRVNRIGFPRGAPFGLGAPREEGTSVTGPLLGGRRCLGSPSRRPGMVLVFGG